MTGENDAEKIIHIIEAVENSEENSIVKITEDIPVPDVLENESVLKLIGVLTKKLVENAQLPNLNAISNGLTEIEKRLDGLETDDSPNVQLLTLLTKLEASYGEIAKATIEKRAEDKALNQKLSAVIDKINRELSKQPNTAGEQPEPARYKY